MKFIAVVLVALAVSAQADESEYANYQTNYDHYSQAEAGYNSDLTSAYNYVSEKQDIDMDVILPIAVFGGLGLGALAYIDTLNRQNNLCNKLREVTNVARANAATGTTNVALVAEAAGGPITLPIANAANIVILGNRDFINALALIDNLDC